MTSSSRPAQTYSVYDYDTQRFRYYAAPLGNVPASGFTRKAKSTLAEGLVATLPPSAVPIGEGDEPQGILAVPRSGSFVAVLFGGAVAAGGAWWWWRRRRRSA